MAAKKKMTEEIDNTQEMQDMTIEEGFSKLNDLLRQMESEEMGLEGSFDLYKRGVDLVKVLNSKLDNVEGKLTEVEE